MSDVVLLIPVKPLHLAKTRLRRDLGTAVEPLVLAMAADVVGAAVACPAITTVVVITNDAVIGRHCTGAGAQLAPDAGAAGLNEALSVAISDIRAAMPAATLICQPADCPSVLPQDFAAITVAAQHHGRVFVADASGGGTTTLASRAGSPLQPGYGEGSAARHRAEGAVGLHGPKWRRLSRDVDVLADLRQAAGIGVGPQTNTWLRANPWG